MIYNRKFLYKREVVGGIRELDYLQTPLIYQDFPIDREITITDSMSYRPDLVSRVAYGSPNYGWLLMDHNDILDPYEQLITGTVIEVPRIDQYFNFYNENSIVSRQDRLTNG